MFWVFVDIFPGRFKPAGLVIALILSVLVCTCVAKVLAPKLLIAVALLLANCSTLVTRKGISVAVNVNNEVALV